MIHDLKIEPKWFGDVLSGRKKFEVRLNDREFAVGDVLHLMEYHKEDNSFGMDDMFNVIYVFDNNEFLKDGYVILGIEPVNELETLHKYVDWCAKNTEVQDNG